MKKAEIVWQGHSSWDRKTRAHSVAKELRAPGDDKVRARVVREVSWRVEIGYPLLKG